MLNLRISTVPDDQQRYNTVGDYYVNEKGERVFVISDMKDWHFELLTAIHELVESAICRHRGVTDEMIDQFDLEYDAKRAAGDVSEPGDSPEAPYYEAHQFANQLEQMLGKELDVDWEEYATVVDKLMKNQETI